jgi:A/G-specific adenine glycosylase
LAEAPLDDVLALWSGLGYYARARNLHRAARVAAERFGGDLPEDLDDLVSLPGIGRSTAGAILALSRGARHPILDGNVKRVLARHRGVDGWSGESRVQAALWRFADELLPEDAGDMRAYTQGMMDIGATICTRARPHCDLCPIRDDCIARLAGRIAAIPAPRPRKALPRREVTVLLLERDGDVLLERRPAVGIWGGLWSLPEISRDTDVAAYVAVHLAATTGALQCLPPLTHGFTHYALTMHPVRVEVLGWPLEARMRDVEWFARDEAPAAIPAPIRKLLRARDPAEFRLTG